MKQLRINVYHTFRSNRPLDNQCIWQRFEPYECFLIIVIIIIIFLTLGIKDSEGFGKITENYRSDHYSKQSS